MPFPNADLANVSEDKLCNYLLNFFHPVGGTKAVWFASLGYTLENWEDLRNDLLVVAQTCENYISHPSPFGVKYETSGKIGCDGFQIANVLVVWIVEENSNPRLVTAYPEKK